MLLNEGPKWLTRAMLCIALSLCAIVVILGITEGTQGFFPAIAVLLAAAVCCAMPRLHAALLRLGSWKVWAILTILCLIVKGAWVLLVRVPLSGDYATFWWTAAHFSQKGTVYNARYLALFPHIWGYSGFLSVWIGIFGQKELLAQMINVFLTACSGSLLFLLLRDRPCRAALAYLLWIICPSQTMYNSLVLSEPLYTTLMLGAALLVVEIYRKGGQWKRPVVTGILAGTGGGLLLRQINMVRPVAAICIIALVIWLFLLSPELLTRNEKTGTGNRRLLLSLLPALLLSYLLTGPIVEYQLTRLLGEPPASTPGFNLYVGLNEATGGSWGVEDSALLTEYIGEEGATARTIQDKMMGKALERLTSLEDPLGLLWAKLRNFLGNDHDCVLYSAAALQSRSDMLQGLCDIFWYFLIAMAMAGMVRIWRDDCRGPILLAPLYWIGLTMAHMLAEAAGRYHYSLIPALIALAAMAPRPEKLAMGHLREALRE